MQRDGDSGARTAENKKRMVVVHVVDVVEHILRGSRRELHEEVC